MEQSQRAQVAPNVAPQVSERKGAKTNIAAIGNVERVGWILAGFIAGIFAPIIAAIVHHGRPTRMSAVVSTLIGIGCSAVLLFATALAGFAACIV